MQEQHKLPTQADKNYGEVIMYQTDDGQTQLDVRLENDTIWLTANQMALLFGRDEKTIRKHINNAITEELYDSVVVAKFATTTKHARCAYHYDCRIS